ncbi:MarR family winged helix-turn-helix transcriptional regulator [Saccharomonospora sp. NPDC006951]
MTELALTKPIGYWLRHLHELLESTFTATLGAEGLTRRHWQILNVLAENPSGDVDHELAPFLDADTPTFAPFVADLAAKGWVHQGELTGLGRAEHARISAEVAGIRRKAIEGISNEQYLDTIRTLSRMTANLGGGE